MAKRMQRCGNSNGCDRTFRHGYPGDWAAISHLLFCSTQCMFEHGISMSGRVTKKMRDKYKGKAA